MLISSIENLSVETEQSELDVFGRHEYLSKFNYSVVVECDYPELDVAIRWAWLTLGPIDGECLWTEYPVCPQILETETIEHAEIQGKLWRLKRYRHAPAHRHVGAWSILWLEKTDYDHGFAEFYFLSLQEKDLFIEAVPSFDWGENYPCLNVEK